MINYRRATIDDLTKITSIEGICFKEADRFSKKNLQRMLLNPRSSIFTDLILFNNEIIGYAVFLTRKNSKKIRLYSICILPQFSGRGLAKEYLNRRIIDFTRSYSEIILEVRETNLAALKLYKNIGVAVNNKLPNYYPDGETGYKLIKRLI